MTAMLTLVDLKRAARDARRRRNEAFKKLCKVLPEGGGPRTPSTHYKPISTYSPLWREWINACEAFERAFAEVQMASR